MVYVPTTYQISPLSCHYYASSYYICSMDRQLNEIGTIPVTTSIVESLYPELKSANKKVTWLEKQGVIIRLKRGLYVLNPEYSGKALSSELIANHLYTPSYISMSTALRYYGLIPETVYKGISDRSKEYE